MKEYMTTGEFANLCETTKETLRHYDRIGLLHPALVKDNGYKMYSFFQFADFGLIASLRSAGFTLDQIKEYREESSEAAMRRILTERIAAIEHERKVLASRQATLELTLASTAALESWRNDEGGEPKWKIEERPSICYLRTPSPFTEDRVEPLLEAARDHMGHVRSLGISTPWQSAYCFDGALFRQHRYAEGMSICTPLPKSCLTPAVISSPRFHRQPATRYLLMLMEMRLEDVSDFDSPNLLFEAYDRFLQLACDQGIRLTGDAFNTELSLFSGNVSEPMRLEISMEVAE